MGIWDRNNHSDKSCHLLITKFSFSIIHVGLKREEVIFGLRLLLAVYPAEDSVRAELLRAHDAETRECPPPRYRVCGLLLDLTSYSSVTKIFWAKKMAKQRHAGKPFCWETQDIREQQAVNHGFRSPKWVWCLTDCLIGFGQMTRKILDPDRRLCLTCDFQSGNFTRTSVSPFAELSLVESLQ